MKKILLLAITLMALPALLNAQINDNYALAPTDLTIEQIGEYQIISVAGNSYTEEPGNPQLPWLLFC